MCHTPSPRTDAVPALLISLSSTTLVLCQYAGTLMSRIDPLQAESLHRHRTAQLVVEGKVGQRAAGLQDLRDIWQA